MSAAVLSLASHLAPLHGERPAVWRWIALRSGGIAAERVLRLASPSWASRFWPADLAFAALPDEAERFPAVRRWRRASGHRASCSSRAQSGAKP